MIDYTCFYCGRFIDGLIGKVYKHGDDAVCEDCEKKYHEGAKNTEQQVQPDSLTLAGQLNVRQTITA